jgi:ribosome biogenesis GTPase
MSSVLGFEPSLVRLGYSSFFRGLVSPLLAVERIARVAVVHKNRYGVLGAFGARDAVLAGRLRHVAEGPLDLPAVGDWVELASGPGSEDELVSIERVVPRRTLLVRRSAGESHRPQPIAANVDSVLIVAAFSASEEERTRSRGVNLRRLERYLVAVRQSGARPVFVINKADLARDLADVVRSVRRVARDAPVVSTSAWSGDGLPELSSHVGPGETVALIGSSGVGKSALSQRLVGRELGAVGEVRADDERGRHTTSHRELFLLPDGGVLIDTPGMRELGLWIDGADADEAFDEIEELAAECRFRDCRHSGEPGCRVRAALAAGELDEDRMSSREKLERELAFERRKVDPRARREAKASVVRRARALRKKYALEDP